MSKTKNSGSTIQYKKEDPEQIFQKQEVLGEGYNTLFLLTIIIQFLWCCI